MNTFKLILHSIGAVLGGYLVSAILTAVTISVLAALFPASYSAGIIGWVIFNVMYGCAFAVVGGYVAARIAPSRPFIHAIVLGSLMAIFALLTGVATANTPPSMPGYVSQPDWYYPVLAITVLPCILLGAWLYIKRVKQ